MKLKVINIGNLGVGEDGRLRSLKNYASFYNELEESGMDIEVFSTVISQGDLGFEFVADEPISESITVRTCRGNTPVTPQTEFVYNNVVVVLKLASFCAEHCPYFVYLPSFHGAVGLCWLLLLGRATSLGLYIGGDFAAEQRYEKRSGILRRFLKRAGRRFIGWIVRRGILEAEYVITSSYKLLSEYEQLGKIMMTPPMLNVGVDDLALVDGTDLPGEELLDISFCGELRHAKGVIELLHAFALLADSAPTRRLRLKIIGTGQAQEEMQAFARERLITERVLFLGHLKDREKLKHELKTSLMLVLPSFSEGFPRVAYEAFTLGVPCILSPVGGIPYLLRDRVHCLFVRPGDVRDLYDKIRTLALDYHLRRHLATNAIKLMKETIFPRINRDRSLAHMVTRKVQTAVELSEQPLR